MAKIQIRRNRPSAQDISDDIDEYEAAAEEFRKAVAEDYGDGSDDEEGKEEIPTISWALQQLAEKELQKIDKIFVDPDFFASVTAIMMIGVGHEGASEEAFGNIYNEICEITENDPETYSDSIDFDNLDLEDLMAKIAKLPPAMKATVAANFAAIAEDAEDDEDGQLEWIAKQLEAMF